MLKQSLTALALVAVATVAAAQAHWPDRAVTLVVPFPPGGGTDTGARIMAEQLSRKWGQPVVVDNKGGAAGQVGADFVAKAKPDGYTLLVGNIGTQAINPSLYPRMPFDPDKAFAPISMIAELPLAMMVNPKVPAKTVQEFIALAKSQPGKLNYSSSGAGGAPHLAAELFKDASGTFILHVPYRGGGPAVADLLAGHVQASFMTVLEASAHIKAGKLRALAIAGKSRSSMLPGVPTVEELKLPDAVFDAWYAIAAPAKTPQSVIRKLVTEVEAVTRDSGLQEQMRTQGMEPVHLGPVATRAMIDDEIGRYRALAHRAKIVVD